MNAHEKIEQRSDDWFKARLGRATASRFSDCLAKIKTGEAATRKAYRVDIVGERIEGVPAKTFFNEAMQWGIDNEPIARAAYELRTGDFVDECGFFQHHTLMAGASPDGLVRDDGIIEIKCPQRSTHIEYLEKGELPSKYKAQVQGQLWITGRSWADFVSFYPTFPEHLQLMIVRVERDEDYIATLQEGIEEFLYECDQLYKTLMRTI